MYNSYRLSVESAAKLHTNVAKVAAALASLASNALQLIKVSAFGVSMEIFRWAVNLRLCVVCGSVCVNVINKKLLGACVYLEGCDQQRPECACPPSIPVNGANTVSCIAG